MKEITIFEGDELKHSCPPDNNRNFARCRFFGRDRGSQVTVPFTDDTLGKHLLFLGGIGTGKTNALFQVTKQIRYSLSEKDVVVIFDTKGDFRREFYRDGDIVISNDDTATGAKGADYWNIINEIEKGEHLEEYAAEIAQTLFKEKTENSSQPFFPNAAKDIFSALLIHAVRCGGEGISTNNGLRNLFDRCDAEKITEILSQHSDLKAICSYISDPRSAQTQGVLSELQQMTREIFIGNFRKPGTLSMKDLVREKGGKIIFIEYDLGMGNALTPIYRLMFDLAIKEALSRNKSDGNVWFICDEFRLLPKLSHMEDAVNFGRSLGVKFLIGIQNVEQLYVSYGESKARSIMSGFLTNVVFRVNDAASREYVRGIFGSNRKQEIYTSSIQSRGITEQLRDGNVVEDWDITRLNIGEAIIGLPGREPFVFQFSQYRNGENQ
jgi:type IV secretory pathway TraG/TraD family ATPase VirD4